MARKIGVASISTGEYEKDGEKKKSWLNIGVVFEDEKGNVSIKFTVLPVPVPGKDGYPAAWVKIFLDDNKPEKPPAYKPPPRYSEDDQPENDIPF